MVTKKNQSALPQGVIDRYDALLRSLSGIERKGAKNPYTSFNGNMFTFLDPKSGQLSIRLPKVAREDFIKKYNTTLSVQYATVMEEYVVVPNELFNNLEELQLHINNSFDYVKSLKPKPTKK